VKVCSQWRFWGFHFGGHWGGNTFIWGHTTNTFSLNYRVCNQHCFPIRSFITLAENFGKWYWRPYLELFFLGGGQEFHWRAAAPLAPLGNAPVCSLWNDYCCHFDHAMNGLFKWLAYKLSSDTWKCTISTTSKIAK